MFHTPPHYPIISRARTGARMCVRASTFRGSVVPPRHQLRRRERLDDVVGGSRLQRDKKSLIPRVIVAGVRTRATGQVKAQVVENVEAKTLLPFINKQRNETNTRH